MQTDYLRYFVDVATLGSMSAAAKKNFMTPQGISRSITSLENELGCELFRRDSNKVTLTRYGEQLLQDSRGLIERENSLRRNIMSLNSEAQKKRNTRFLCYGSPIFFDTPLFFPASGLVTAQYAKVQFLQRTTPEVVSLLLDAQRMVQTDIIIAGGLGLFDLFADENARMLDQLRDAGYEYRPFMRTHDYVLVPEYSPLAKAEALAKEQIASWRLAVASTGGMERAISRHIGADSIFVSSGDSAYRSYLCRMGEALTFVPGLSLVYGVPEGTVAVPMEEPYTIEIGFAAHLETLREGVLADVISKLADFYAEHAQQGEYELM